MNDFPIGPEKHLGSEVAPSKCRPKSCKGSALACNKHASHSSDFCSNCSSCRILSHYARCWQRFRRLLHFHTVENHTSRSQAFKDFFWNRLAWSTWRRHMAKGRWTSFTNNADVLFCNYLGGHARWRLEHFSSSYPFDRRRAIQVSMPFSNRNLFDGI